MFQRTLVRQARSPHLKIIYPAFPPSPAQVVDISTPNKRMHKVFNTDHVVESVLNDDGEIVAEKHWPPGTKEEIVEDLPEEIYKVTPEGEWDKKPVESLANLVLQKLMEERGEELQAAIRSMQLGLTKKAMFILPGRPASEEDEGEIVEYEDQQVDEQELARIREKIRLEEEAGNEYMEREAVKAFESNYAAYVEAGEAFGRADDLGGGKEENLLANSTVYGTWKGSNNEEADKEAQKLLEDLKARGRP